LGLFFDFRAAIGKKFIENRHFIKYLIFNINDIIIRTPLKTM